MQKFTSYLHRLRALACAKFTYTDFGPWRMQGPYLYRHRALACARFTYARFTYTGFGPWRAQSLLIQTSGFGVCKVYLYRLRALACAKVYLYRRRALALCVSFSNIKEATTQKGCDALSITRSCHSDCMMYRVIQQVSFMQHAMPHVLSCVD